MSYKKLQNRANRTASQIAALQIVLERMEQGTNGEFEEWLICRLSEVHDKLVNKYDAQTQKASAAFLDSLIPLTQKKKED